MMHALGFLHEQNRWERDKHVTVNYDNVQDGKHKPDVTSQQDYSVSQSRGSPLGVLLGWSRGIAYLWHNASEDVLKTQNDSA